MYSKDNLVFNLIQNIFVGLTITISVTLMTEGFSTASAFMVSFFKAYVINYVACLIIPVLYLTKIICQKFKIDAQGIFSRIIQTALCDIGYVTMISVVMFLWELGFTYVAFQAWKSVYVILLAVGFIVGFFMGSISMRITQKIIRK